MKIYITIIAEFPAYILVLFGNSHVDMGAL